jgi:hypothetical protein
MEPRNRRILVMAIALTIMVALAASFMLPLFYQLPEIVRPAPDNGQGTGTPGGESGEDENYVVVGVTTETVQDVIATLHRDRHHYRKLVIELFWGSDQQTERSTTTVQAWTDGENQKTAVMAPDGTMQNDLIVDGWRYLWYAGDRTYDKRPVGDNTADLIQHIPTYEDVLALDKEQIIAAGYESKNGISCIYVEELVQELGYLHRYWISTGTGLLVASETVYQADGQLCYRMMEEICEPLGKEEVPFVLPDGRELYRIPLGAQAEE